VIAKKPREYYIAKRILHIVVAAARPLTLREMALAVTIRENHRSYSDLDLRSQDWFHEDIRDICGLFVTIIESRIYLLHQTAKEFLVRHGQKILRKNVHSGLKWKHSLWPQDSHRLLTEICMRYLLFTEFEANPLDNDMMPSQYGVFLDYSAKNWAAHVRQSHIEVDKIATQSMLRLCDASSACCRTWFGLYWKSTNTDFPEKFTALMIASYFGLSAVVKHLLSQGESTDLDSKDSTYGRSAISWAAENGFDNVVKLLIEGVGGNLRWCRQIFKRGAQVDSVDKYSRTPLMYAVWNRHEAVVKRLLRAGACIDLADNIGGTALLYGFCSGHDDLFKLLFKKGTEIDLKDDTIMGLFFPALAKDHEAVKLLLETGKVNPGMKDVNGRGLLSHAVEARSVAIAQHLLAKGVKMGYKYKIVSKRHPHLNESLLD
jgi:ankyrin repeat domain-containing protein 50